MEDESLVLLNFPPSSPNIVILFWSTFITYIIMIMQYIITFIFFWTFCFLWSS